ncbi:MAG: ATPase domain-containing protein, partial [Chthoniobacteraceae bacterium]
MAAAISNETGAPSRSQTVRATTGVPGFDNILHGGLPKNRLYLIQGDPGVGKT